MNNDIITQGDLRQSLGMQPRTFQMKWQKVFGESCDQAAKCTLEQIETFRALVANGRGAKRGAISRPVRTTAANSEVREVANVAPKAKRKSEATKFYAPLMVCVLSVALTGTGLWIFADGVGLLVGLMFAAYIGSTLLVSQNKQKGDTSGGALKTVFWMEAGAACLHFFTFYTRIQADNLYLKAGAAAVIAFFAAFMSYRAVVLVRDYYAEAE